LIFSRKEKDMASAIDDTGHLSFGPNDQMIRRLTELGIEWDIQTLPLACIDLHDNTYQTRFDAGSADEEYVLRYKDSYHMGEHLPMPLVVVPFSSRNVQQAAASPCCGRHRLEAARRAGAKTATFLRALPKHQGDIDALRDLSLFDNAANGKSVSTDETYGYCSHEVIAKHGGLSAGMPDSKFITNVFRRWDGRGIHRQRLVLHVKSLLAKMKCNSIGLATPAGHIDGFAKMWSWSADPAFDALAKAVCPAADEPDMWKALSAARRKSAAEALSEVANARRGYRGSPAQPQDAATVVMWRCRDIRKVLSKLESDMALDFAMLDSIESQVEGIYAETHEVVSRLRAKIGGLVHA
jgi:hypothetical protein